VLSPLPASSSLGVVSPRPPRTISGVPHKWLGPAALAAVIVVVLIVALGVPGGAGEPPPATGAATVVPAYALAYVHLSTDGARPAVKRAEALAARFPDYPLLTAAVISRLNRAFGNSSSLHSAGIRPWLGKEAALAMLGSSPSAADSLMVLDVRDRRRARAFVDAAGARPSGAYRGRTLLRLRSRAELAFVGRYLALGQDWAVRAAIDVASHRSSSLASSPAYRNAASGEPASRVLDAYASTAGLRDLLASRGGLLGALQVLLSQPRLIGTTVSVSAVSGGARIRVHSALTHAGGEAPPQFTPTLQGKLPAGSMLLLDVTGLDRVAPNILNASATAGVAATIGPLLHRLGAALSSEGFNVQGVVSIFAHEAAIAIATRSGAPSLLVVARTSHQSAARDTLASLEAPLTQLFPPPSQGPGQVPEFNDVRVGSVTAHQLALAPGLQFNYAVFDGLVVASTSINGIAAVAGRTRSLGSDPLFKSSLPERPDRVRSLVFFDFSQLLSLGEQTGLTNGSRVRSLQPDLRKIRAIGLYSMSGEADSTAELSLKIP
jgi:hypothetical protein